MEGRCRCWVRVLGSALILLTPNVSQAELTDRLLAWWSFDGNLSDRLGPRHAVHRGQTRGTYELAKFGQALGFDGQQQFAETTDGRAGDFDTIHASVSLWLRIEEGGVILDKGSSSWTISYNQERDALEFGARRTAFQFGMRSAGELDLDDGEWHHVVCVGSFPDRTFFVDGVHIETRSGNNVGVQGSRFSLAFGGHPSRMPAQDLFKGAIDEVMIWDRALTDTEIAQLWNEGLGQTVHDLFPDADADGLPDVWEKRHRLSQRQDDAAVDLDGDGLTNADEFLLGTDPRRLDTDGDGLSDHVETDRGVWGGPSDTGTSPIQADTDGDGLVDGQETASGVYVNLLDIGTDPLNDDTDGDGFFDGGEVRRQADPTEPLLIPSIASGLIVHHGFDETLDESGGGEPGKWLGESAYRPGVIGESVHLDGRGLVRLQAPEGLTDDLFEGSLPFSIALWYKINVPNVTFGDHLIASFGGSEPWQLAYQSATSRHPLAGGIAFIPASRDRLRQNVFTTDTNKNWHHLVASFDPATERSEVYIDGHLQPTGTERTTTFRNDNESQLLLGGVLEGSTTIDRLRGNVDDLAIWNRIIDATEVRVLYTRGLAGVGIEALSNQDVLPNGIVEVDLDQDGLSDEWEIAFGLDVSRNDAAEDLDMDGLSNKLEREFGTHPGKADTDADGLADFVEVQGDTDPRNADTDGDGLMDGRDAEVGSPILADTDADGIDDGTEHDYGSDPSDADSLPRLHQGLLAYFPMDGDAKDAVGFSRGHWFDPDFEGYLESDLGEAALLVESSQHIELVGGRLETLDFSKQPFSVSFWFQEVSNSATSTVLMSQGGLVGWQVRLDQSTTIRLDAHQGRLGWEETRLEREQFHHIAAVIDPVLGRTSVFVNGLPVGIVGDHALALPPVIVPSTEPIRLGQRLGFLTLSAFNPILFDDVAIWRRPLTEAEIETIANADMSLGQQLELDKDSDADRWPDFQEELVGTDPSDVLDYFHITSIDRDSEGIELQWTSVPGRRYRVEFTPAIIEDVNWQVVTPDPIQVEESPTLFIDRDPKRLASGQGHYRVTILVER